MTVGYTVFPNLRVESLPWGHMINLKGSWVIKKSISFYHLCGSKWCHCSAGRLLTQAAKNKQIPIKIRVCFFVSPHHSGSLSNMVAAGSLARAISWARNSLYCDKLWVKCSCRQVFMPTGLGELIILNPLMFHNQTLAQRVPSII